jgi:predicted Zn finger-like uncharacterized protein
MSLAARCPACGTVFRVVQDQLRVSEGWVRCGRCTEVFNAIENLVDLEADVAAPATTRSPGGDRVMEDLARVSGFHEDGAPPDEGVEHAATEFDERAPHEAARAAPQAAVPAPAAAPAAQATRATTAEDAGMVADPEPHIGHAPNFVRRAERAARWRQPGVRLALALVIMLGTAGLAAQALFVYRDQLAARWPDTRPWLTQTCAALGCRIEPALAIDALAVESSGLVRIQGTSMYRLSVVLHNRAAWSLAMPAIDLTLTDGQGSMIARRVIGGDELGVQDRAAPPLADVPLQATLGAGGRAISGYTIEIFYP